MTDMKAKSGLRVWGDHKFQVMPNGGGDHKIIYPYNRGSQKYRGRIITNFVVPPAVI